MSHSTISLGLGLGGGKSATSSGAPGGGSLYPDELTYPGGLFSGTNYEISIAPEMHFMAGFTTGETPPPAISVDEEVAAWADCSGNNHDFAQGTASLQGVYKEPGGFPAIYLELDYYTISSIPWTQEMTVVFVGYATAPDTYLYSLTPLGSASSGAMTYYGTTYDKMRVWSSTFGSNVDSMRALNMYTVTRGVAGSGTQRGYWQGGALDSTQAAGTLGVANYPITNIGLSGGTMVGNIMEIMYFADDLSEGDSAWTKLNTITDYVANKYGVTTGVFS